MEEDDDMIMIIVGDDHKEAVPMPIQLQSANFIKLEQNTAPEIDLDSILRNAEANGEYLGNFSDLMDNNNSYKDAILDRYDDEYLSDSDESDRRRNKFRPKVSYVAQLQKNFPKMRKDEDYLVSHITELMKQAKPPAPPIGFCKCVNGQLVCAYCSNVSPSLPIAGRHYQKKHGARYLLCYACGADFRCTTGLYKHEKRCTSEGVKIVLMARGRFLGRRGRQRPYLTLGKFDPWDLSNPKNRHHCKSCNAHYATVEALRSHESVHKEFRPFQCDQCPAAFTQGVLLKRHLVLHTRDHRDRCICDTCGRSFKNKTTLITHMNTHLPERRYPCAQCGRRFAQKAALRSHVHRDHWHLPPPFACSECPRRFPRMFNLKSHLKTKHGMTLMTRQMFIKALPTMKEEEIKEAKFVINSDVKDDKTKMSTFATNSAEKSRQDKSDHVCLDISYTTDERPRIKKEVLESDPYLETLEYGGKNEHVEDSDEDDEETIVSSDSTMQVYLSSHEIEEDEYTNTESLDEGDEASVDETSPTITKRDDEIPQEYTPISTENEEIVEEIDTPNDAVVRTVLQENCEIEFATTVAKTSECDNDIEAELSKMFAESDENTSSEKVVSEEKSKTAKVAKAAVTPKKAETTVTTRKTVKTTSPVKNTTPIASKIQAKKDCKNKTIDSVKKSDGIRKSSPRLSKTIGTRSDAMKTRSGTKIRK